MENLVAQLIDIDNTALLAVNQWAARRSVLDQVVFDISNSDMLKGGIFMAVYWWLWFDRRGAMQRDVVVAIVAAIGTAVLSRLLQVALPFHQRPLHTPDLDVRLPLSVDPSTLNTFSSFPSDHAMLFFALSVPLWRRAPWLGVVATVWTVFVICLPRVFLGYHYPSDILAGALLGIPCMLALSWLVARTGMAERVVRFGNLHPAAFFPVAFLLCFELATLFADIRSLLLDVYRIAGVLTA